MAELWQREGRLLTIAKSILLSLCLCQLLSGCAPARQSLPVPISLRVNITDPVYLQLIRITDRITLKAHGVLAEGTYTIHGLPVKVDSDTTFTLDATVPVNGASEITTKGVSGSLTTNRPLTVQNVPCPLHIQLLDGAGSADVDFGRTLLMFILNSLQGSTNQLIVPSTRTGERQLSELVSTASVDSAKLDFKPDSSIQFPGVKANIGVNSNLQFSAIHFDKDLNYKGKCKVHLKLPHLELDDNKASRKLEFDNAEMNLDVQANKVGNAISLTLLAGGNGLLATAAAKVSTPSTSLTFAQGTIELKNCTYKRILGQETPEVTVGGTITVKKASIDSRQQQSAESKFDFENFTGNVQFAHNDRKMQSDGKFNMNISSSENMLGIKGARAIIRDLEFHSDENKFAINLPTCRLSFPSAEIRNLVVKNLPAKRIFEVNKVVNQGQKWRYRNFKLQRVIIANPSLSKLSVIGKDKFAFNAASDVTANGTVEKFELHPLTPGHRTSWNALPWSAHAHVKGIGDVTTNFLPGQNIADSVVQYKVACKTPVPDKLQIDWSRVSGDVLGRAEQAIVEKVVQNANYFVPAQGIPINFDGQFHPLKNKRQALKSLKVRSFRLTVAAQEVVIDLNVAASL